LLYRLSFLHCFWNFVKMVGGNNYMNSYPSPLFCSADLHICIVPVPCCFSMTL
jgi:hypothetical protein